MAKLRTDLNTIYLRMLVYGDAGSGKTRLVCTSCLDDRLAPVLYLNVSGNPESIRSYSKLPTIIDIEKLTDFDAIYDWLAKEQPKNHPFRNTFDLTHHAESTPYKTLIIDQLSQVQTLSFQVVMNPEGLTPAQHPVKRTFTHYQAVLHQMDNFIIKHFKLPLHIILTAWEKQMDKERYPSSKAVVPMLEGEGRHTVVGHALIAGRLVNKTHIKPVFLKAMKANNDEPKQNVIFFTETGSFTAKNQYNNKLSDYICDPTMTQIYSGIGG